MKNKNSSTNMSSPPRSAPSHDDVAARAYTIWLNHGCPENRDLEHWLEAERQLQGGAKLRDEAFRLTNEEFDPAASEAAKVDAEIEQMAESPRPRRSPTSLDR